MSDTNGKAVAPPTGQTGQKTPYFEVAYSNGWHWVLWDGSGAPAAICVDPYKTREEAALGAATANMLMFGKKLRIVSAA